MLRPANLLIAGAVLLTIIAGALLVAGVPTVQRLPGWFWPIRDRGILTLGVIIAVAFALPLMVGLVSRGGRGTGTGGGAAAIVALMIFGFALQYGLALAELRGVDGLRDRMLRTGHAEFARTASLELGYRRVLTRYEQLMHASGQAYARSKPPGQVLVYMALSSIADAVMPARPAEAPLQEEAVISKRHRRLVDFATIVLPLLSVLAVIPLFLLARLLLPHRFALWPALLYLLAPPTALVTLHLDQALYPLLATTIWVLAAYAGAAGRRSWMWGAAAGVVAWFGLFISFSLLPAIPLAAVIAWTTARDNDQRSKTKQLAPAMAGFIASFLVLASLAQNLANYDMVLRYRTAMGYHRAWMIATHPGWDGWPEAPGFLLSSSLLNLGEFGYWLGLPLLGVFVWAVAAGTYSLVRPPHYLNRADLLSLTTALLLLAMAWFGGSIGETARLWIFMIPPIALVAADRVTNLKAHNPRTILLVLAATQFTWMFLLKAKQDFW